MNNKIAQQALPKAKPYELRDAKLNGLLLRVQPSGVKTWYLEFERGKRIRLGRLSSMGHSEAVEAAKNALGPYWAGTDPRIERQKRKQVSTFGDFIDEHYADWAAAHQKTATATIKRLKVSFKKFLNMPMATISPLDMERWRAQRMKDGVKTNTVNRDITAIKAALKRRQRRRPVLRFAKAKPVTVGCRPFVQGSFEARVLHRADPTREAPDDHPFVHVKFRSSDGVRAGLPAHAFASVRCSGYGRQIRFTP